MHVSTEALFQLDAYLRSCTARVVEVLPNGVVLDRTVFYPLGGGQPGDTGNLRGRDGREWRVVDTRKGDEGRVLHQLEADIAPPATGDEVEALLDWERRYAHMRMHSCLHLLGSVLRYGVTGGQIASDKAGSTSTRRRKSIARAFRRRQRADHGQSRGALAVDHRRGARPAARARAHDVGAAAARRGTHPPARYRRCRPAAVRWHARRQHRRDRPRPR